VFVEDPEAIELFQNGGAKVDQVSKVVKLQQYMVEEAIASAPSKLFLAGRIPENDIIL
jgi:trimethylamine--corrinoid protein Co-methyltransferase